MINPNDIINERYRLIELVGEGSFGEVWRCEDLTDGGEKAVKICVSLDKSGQEEFLKEHELSSSLAHPNILSTEDYGVWEKHPYIVMQYMAKGSATGYVGTLSPCEKDEKIIWQFIYDVASGLEYLHGFSPNPIVHQDIKPANILINTNGHFVISDFGISKQLRDTMRTQSKRGNTAGAAAYMAPERFAPHPPTIMASDIWSLGASIYELAEGVLPFSGLGGCVQGSGVKLPPMSKGWSKELKKVQRSCMELKPYDRKRACDIKEIAYGMLNPEPKEPVSGKLKSWREEHTRAVRLISAILTLTLFVSIIIRIGNSCTGSHSPEENDTTEISSPGTDSLQYLADLLDAKQPTEVGALYDNVLYYKKDTLYYFIDSVGKPIANGEAFDGFEKKEGVVKTIRKVFTKETLSNRPHGKKYKEIYGIISSKGKVLLPCDNEEIVYPLKGLYAYSKQSLWGCVSESGEILKHRYTSIKYGGLEGLMLCRYENGYYEFIDSTGQCVLPTNESVVYYDAHVFRKGYALVKDSQKGKSFFINEKGEKAFSDEYLHTEDSFLLKFAKVYKLRGSQKLYGLIDLNFNESLPCEYDYITYYYYGDNAFTVKKEGQWMVVNSKGETIAKLTDSFDCHFYSNFMWTKDGALYIDNKKTTYKLDYGSSDGADGMGNVLRCKINGNYHVITKDGRISEPYSTCDYDSQAELFKVTHGRKKSYDYNSSTRVLTLTTGGYGLIDENLNVIVGFEYYVLGGYGNGLFYFKKNSNSLYGYMDKKGNVKIGEMFTDVNRFIDGYAVVKYQGQYGVIDTQGKFLIKNIYDSIIYNNSKYLLGGKKGLFISNVGDYYGIVDASTQKVIVPCEYDNKFEYVSSNRFPILKDGKWGFYTNDGRSTLKMSNNSNTKQQ